MCIVTTIRYVSSIHSYNTQYISSILKFLQNITHYDIKILVLLTGLPKVHFNVPTTLKDSRPVQNGNRSQFGVEWVVYFWYKKKTLKYFLFG